MKFLLDFLPLILFFGSFQYAEAHKEWAASFASSHFGFMVSGGVVGPDEAPVLLATILMALVTIVQVTLMKLLKHKIHLMLWITLALVVVLGAATVWFASPIIIKWKPSIAYWTLGLCFWVSRALFNRDLLQEMLGGEMDLPEFVWQRLNYAWVGFLSLMGVLNLYVAYSFTTSTWASFKVFGATGLMLAFSVGQVVYLSRYLKPEEAETKPSEVPK
jgi:intracellular septation protein